MSMNIQLERKNSECNFDFSNPKILHKEHNLEKRLILENDKNFK